MITELYIENIALIDQVQLTFSPRFNILTGETGAGKSVILHSLGLVLGERIRGNIVRQSQEQARIQIVADPVTSVFQQIQKTLQTIEIDDEELVTLHRQITQSGRSRSNINGHVINLKQLKTLGHLLVDIHGQHQHQSLFQQGMHGQILDDYGGLIPLRQEVTSKYESVQSLIHQISQLNHDYQKLKAEKDLLTFQVKEIAEADLQVGEEEELNKERQRLSNAQQLFELADQIYQGLHGGQMKPSLLDILRTLNKSSTKLADLDERIESTNQRLESTLYEIEDLAQDMRDYRDQIEFLPSRLNEIEDRLSTFSRMKQKYGATTKQVIGHYQKSVEKLEVIELSSEKIKIVQEKLQKVKKSAQAKAEQLSVKRKSIARKLETLIQKELRTLSMEKAQFYISQEQTDLTATGIDSIEFLVATNIGSELKPLVEIASGGEISRLMLALKSILAQTDPIPTLIFDEIDVGIGGHTANVVGHKLKQLSQFRQLICISHLPQIASLADKHFRINKKVIGKNTFITAKELTIEERVEEIARMQGGQDTDTAIAHAKELLNLS